MAMPKQMLKWRAKQAPGAIMPPEEFQAIVQSEKKKGLSADRAKRAAGATYWRTAKAKYKAAKK